MHIEIAHIDRMQLVELDELRHQLRLTKKQLCEAGKLDPSTYTRWMRHVTGREGGSCPQPRSIDAIRNVLKQEVMKRIPPRRARRGAHQHVA